MKEGEENLSFFLKGGRVKLAVLAFGLLSKPWGIGLKRAPFQITFFWEDNKHSTGMPLCKSLNNVNVADAIFFSLKVKESTPCRKLLGTPNRHGMIGLP